MPFSDKSAGAQDREAKILHATCGVPFQVRLWEDRTRGEQWVPAYESTSLVLVNDDFNQTASGNAMETGRRVFEFQAIESGKHRLVFEKRMGWKFTAEDRRVFVVVATDGSQPPGAT
jgi:predicted secreted protein